MISFGFIDSTLTSKNALIPIIYYLYHKNIYTNFHNKVSFTEDRALIKKWLHVAIIKRLFGGTSDTVLSQIRKSFSTDILKKPIEFDCNLFPIEAIHANTKREMGITIEFINEILLTQKDDAYSFSILALLYPNLDYRNNNFHKDHLHPEIAFKSLDKITQETYSWKNYNSILNLQMLGSNENMSKKDTDLLTWVQEQSKNRDLSNFLDDQLIPNIHDRQDCGLRLEDFLMFIENRKELLTNKLQEILK